MAHCSHLRVARLMAHLPSTAQISMDNTSSVTPFHATENRVKIEIKDGIAVVSLNRAEKKNALDSGMFKALAEAGAYLQTAPGVRVVVLTGEGLSFCSGLDLASLKTLNSEGYWRRLMIHVALRTSRNKSHGRGKSSRCL